MEYQKKQKSLLGNTPKQPFNFRSEDCVDINYDSRGMYNISSQI